MENTKPNTLEVDQVLMDKMNRLLEEYHEEKREERLRRDEEEFIAENDEPEDTQIETVGENNIQVWTDTSPSPLVSGVSISVGGLTIDSVDGAQMSMWNDLVGGNDNSITVSSVCHNPVKIANGLGGRTYARDGPPIDRKTRRRLDRMMRKRTKSRGRRGRRFRYVPTKEEDALIEELAGTGGRL